MAAFQKIVKVKKGNRSNRKKCRNILEHVDI